MRLNSVDRSITTRIDELLKMGYEINSQPKYHYREIEGALDGSKSIGSSYTFFNVQTGQEGTTKEDTNMDKASVIPSPDEMWVQSVRFVVMPSKSDTKPLLRDIDKTALEKHIFNDMGKILNRGVVTINQLGRDMLEISPLMLCPSGFGVVSPSVEGFDTNISGGLPFASVPLMSNARPVELYLVPEMSFSVKIEFPFGVFPLYNSLRIGFILEGFYARPKVNQKKLS